MVATTEPMPVNHGSGDCFTVNGSPASVGCLRGGSQQGAEAKQRAGDAFGCTLTLAWQAYDHENLGAIA